MGYVHDGSDLYQKISPGVYYFFSTILPAPDIPGEIDNAPRQGLGSMDFSRFDSHPYVDVKG